MNETDKAGNAKYIDARIVRNVAVPTWMVTLFAGSAVVATAWVGSVLIQDRQRLATVEASQWKMESRLAEISIKQDDIVHALNAINKKLDMPK